MKEKYPHLMAFYYDAEKVKLTWRFDEQQADGIHRAWNLTKMKNEIKSLLASQQNDSADAKPCPGFDCKTELRPFTLHVPGCSRCR